jgi:enoyl-CoA hydratase
MSPTVRVERSGPVATVILDRPDVRNACDPVTAAALAAACLAAEADPEIRVLVLWGTGGTFCAGADLRAVAQGFDPARLLEPSGAADDADGPMGVSRLDLSKPVIAAIAGHAVAGGLEIALWCDLRVAEEDAKLGVLCRRWGVPLIDGGTVRLPRLIGESRARSLQAAWRCCKAANPRRAPRASSVAPAVAAPEVPPHTALHESSWSLDGFAQHVDRSPRRSEPDPDDLHAAIVRARTVVIPGHRSRDDKDTEAAAARTEVDGDHR